MPRPNQIPERKRVALIGDGKTEFAYIESLKIAYKDKLSGYSLKPRLPKDSSVKELERFIVDNLDYDKVLCIIDMDTKLKKQKEFYEKKPPFCTHQHIIKCGGNFKTAVINGRKSIDSKEGDDRDYTYSEMVRFFEEIGIL